MSNEWNAEAPGMQASLPHDLEEAHVEILAARARIAELESRERARSTGCQDTLRATLRLRESIREAVAPVLSAKCRPRCECARMTNIKSGSQRSLQ